MKTPACLPFPSCAASMTPVTRLDRDADGAAVSFRYRCPDNPGKVYLFKAASYGEGGPTSFFLAERGGETYSAGVDLAPLRCTDTIDFSDESFFEVRGSVSRGLQLPEKIRSWVVIRVQRRSQHYGVGCQHSYDPRYTGTTEFAALFIP